MRSLACVLAVFAAALPLAAATKWDKKVEKTAEAVRAASARAPAEVRIDSTIRAAELLRPTHPQLAWQLATSAAEQVKDAKDGEALTWRVVPLLLAIKTAEGEKIARGLPAQSAVLNASVSYWIKKQDPARAADVIKEAWRRGFYPGNTGSVLSSLAEKRPQDAAARIRELLDMLSPEKAGVIPVLALQYSAESIAAKEPATARIALAKLLQAVSRESFNAGGSPELVTTYKFGNKSVETLGARDTLLLRLGIYLHSLDPDLYAKSEKLFERWRDDIATLKPGEEEKAVEANIAFMSREALARRRAASQTAAARPKPTQPAPAPKPAPFVEAWAEAMSHPETQRVSSLSTLVRRNDLTQAQQIQAARELLRVIPKLAIEARWAPASMVFGFASGREIKPLLKPAARALAAAMSDVIQCHDPGCQSVRSYVLTMTDYDALAAAVKRSKLRIEDPSVGARVSLIDLRDVLEEKYDFKLAGIQGGEYALRAQNGRVVMLNFWATT